MEIVIFNYDYDNWTLTKEHLSAPETTELNNDSHVCGWSYTKTQREIKRYDEDYGF